MGSQKPKCIAVGDIQESRMNIFKYAMSNGKQSNNTIFSYL